MKTEDELIASLNDPEPEPLPDGPSIEEQPATEETPAPPAAKMLRITLRDGTTFTGATEQDILDQMADKLEQREPEYRQAAREEVRGKVRYQEEHRQPEPWDAQKYLNLLGTDPMEARRYQDRHYYGMDENEDPAEAFRFSYRLADKVADSIEVAEFQRMNGTKDVPLLLSENDSAALLTAMDRENLPLTARNLTAMYHELTARGAITKAEPPDNIEYQEIQRPRSRGQSAPRATGGGSQLTTTASTKTQKDFDAMSKAELNKELKKLGIDV